MFVLFDQHAYSELTTWALAAGCPHPGPEGSPLAEPLAESAKGILCADLGPVLIATAESATAPVGHYSRPDVPRLLSNRYPTLPLTDAPAEPAHPNRTPRRTSSRRLRAAPS